MSPRTDATIAQPSPVVLDDAPCDWKLQRKLRHRQRDVSRRSAGSRTAAESRAKHQEHQSRVDVMRLEKDAWLPVRPKSASRAIPEQLRPTHASRSGPSATSWPPATAEELTDAMDSLTTAACASSAPSVGRTLDAHRHGARHMTLFESARIFNASGRLLSHDALFDEQTLSLSDTRRDGPVKRKFKRRGGRRKHESVRTPMAAVFSTDEVVLELLFLLYPDVDVAQELNRLLLGGAQHEDVFRFDDDDDDLVDGALVTSSGHKGGVLATDLLTTQAALTSMLFGPHEATRALPPRGTAVQKLQELYLTPQWIARAMLATVQLNVLAQYNQFAVLRAIFCAIPSLRSCVLAAAVSASLAIFQHQSALEAVVFTHAARKDLVTAKGMLAFLKAAMDVVERDARDHADVFGSNDDQIRRTIAGLCSQIMRAIQLLVRSSHGGIDNEDRSHNRLEKYVASSDSAEATTYRAMGELVSQVAAFSPMHGEEFVCWMVHKWPRRNVQLQLFFVRFTGSLLLQFMHLGLHVAAAVVRRAFTCLQVGIQSTHFLVAQEACGVCGNLQLMSLYLSRDQMLREKIASALHANAVSHWNQRIREVSDECFDRLLDLA
ncbi:unnamed protein product [Hyaloperonospora brassicae]|uniref:Uncharacterized protein n=1 Tax=Hyaloperonospora brassicae TaxID=162125 RepID=A0AAV0UCR7_HYABA|nr:unnamed protein product [Hyaloperonospora brassicae]